MCVCVLFSPTGQPSVKKCQKVRKDREEAQEIAELDVSNIIATKGNFLSLFLSVHTNFYVIIQFSVGKESLLSISSSQAQFLRIHWPRKVHNFNLCSPQMCN